MPTLSSYLTDVQQLLGTGSAGNLYPTSTLTSYINTARKHVAEDAQCIRVLPPISGPITVINVTSAGTGYTSAPTVIITTPDFPSNAPPFPNGAQATAVASVSGGHVTAITLLSGGAGYFSPGVTLTSGGGTGGVAIALVSAINQTIIGQEVYPFSAINPLVATSGSGINSIFMVNSIATLFGTWRYVYNHVSFSKYQALIRQWATFNYISYVFAQFGQGRAGSVYMYPVPNANYQMEWDVCCVPNDLNNDTDVDAVPEPFAEAVKFYAARLAYLQAQRFEDAKMMYNDEKPVGLYQTAIQRARRVSQPRATSSWYGRQ